MCIVTNSEGKLNRVPGTDDSHGEDRTALSLFCLAGSEQQLVVLTSLKLSFFLIMHSF